MKTCLAVAYSLLNVPYVYGGKSPAYGLDCSEAVQIILRAGGADLPGDQTAQMLFDHFRQPSHHTDKKPQLGALAFYGWGESKIGHVAWLVDPGRHFELAGGDKTTLTPDQARRRGAFGRITAARFPALNFMGCFLPEYPLAIL